MWRDLADRYEEHFSGGMGAESIKDLISRIDMEAEEQFLKDTILTSKGQRKAKAIKRLKVISAFTPCRRRRPQDQLARWAWCSTLSR